MYLASPTKTRPVRYGAPLSVFRRTRLEKKGEEGGGTTEGRRRRLSLFQLERQTVDGRLAFSPTKGIRTFVLSDRRRTLGASLYSRCSVSITALGRGDTIHARMSKRLAAAHNPRAGQGRAGQEH